jgi:hypothetical protein
LISNPYVILPVKVPDITPVILIVIKDKKGLVKKEDKEDVVIKE